MKKTVLLLLIAGVSGFSYAQTSTAAKPKFFTLSPMKLAQQRFKEKKAAEKVATAQPAGSNQSKSRHRIGNEPSLPFLGSAANINGTLDATTTATTANQDCNLIVMTHRDNYSNVGNCGTGGYVAAYSTNGGSGWDTTIVDFCNPASGLGCRYPNGVIFNPGQGGSTPNTNPLNAFDVMSGPYTNGSTTGDSWVSTVYGSVGFGDGGSYDYGMYWANGTTGVITQDNGDLSFMSSSDDSTVHVIGENYDQNSAGDFTAWRGAVLTTGKFIASADSFAWTQTVFWPHIVPAVKGFNNMTLPYDSEASPLAVPGTAWSQDGKTGYVVIFANLDSTGYDYFAEQPIIYKTVNSGTTWTMMPPYNFAHLSSLTTYLYASGDSSIKTPLWFVFEPNGTAQQGAVNSYDLTVDYLGNLHILGAIVSSYYSNTDSSYTISYYNNQHGYIYDVATTTAGGWTARYIDSLSTYPSHAIQSLYSNDWDSSSTDFVGFGARIQASRTYDGKHIFCTWEDDTTGLDANYDVAPDVFGEGYDVATATGGATYQFTHAANMYFLCASDIALVCGSGGDSTYTIPCNVSYPEQIPDDGSTAVNYFYMGSVEYNSSMAKTSGSCFSAVPSVPKQGFSISQNYPNPFSNITQFNISLTNESEVSVDVYNMVGQKVYSIGAQSMVSGNHLITINANGWSSGVYFYKVTADNSSVTKKMVVQ